MGMNKAILHGKILKDLEIRATSGGKSYMTFAIAIPREYKEKGEKFAKTDIVNIRAWGNTAEYVHKYGAKGDYLNVIGRLTLDQYQGNDGEKKSSLYVLAESVEFTRAVGSSSCSGFKKMQKETITNSFDSMGEVEPNVEALDW
jgi:single-strand DNA-binding protein